MQFVRYRAEHGNEWGLLDDLGQVEAISGDPLSGFARSGQKVDASTLRWLAPATPTKIIAIGLNYLDHAAESNKPVPEEPLMFLKPPSALIGSGDTIILPGSTDRVDHEAELAVVIGRKSKNLAKGEWRDAVLGFTCSNDVSNRPLQRKDGQFTRGKGFDTFCPLGRELTTGVDPSDLLLECSVNGEVRQRSRTSQLIFDVDAVLRFVSSVMTLEPWDVILLGTPSGVSPLQDGDIVEVRIDGVGSLSNVVSVAGGGSKRQSDSSPDRQP